MKKINFILFILMGVLVQSMAESSLEYINANVTSSVDINSTIISKNMEQNQSIVEEKKLSIKSVDLPRKSLLELEAEARATIAEEVAKVEIVKANALAVIARVVASVEIAKIREDHKKQNNSDLF